MTEANRVIKRVVLGRALRSDRQSEQELPKPGSTVEPSVIILMV